MNTKESIVQEHANVKPADLALALYLYIVPKKGRTNRPVDRMKELMQYGFVPNFHRREEPSKEDKKVTVVTYDFYVRSPNGIEVSVGSKSAPSFIDDFINEIPDLIITNRNADEV